MKNKKVLALLLVFGICLSLCVPAMAAGTVLKVEQPEKLPSVGETFTVTVSLEGNTGLASIQMALYYNREIVKCTEAKEGAVINSMMFLTNPDTEQENGNLAAMMAAAKENNVKRDGVVMTYTFEVLKAGDPELELKDLILADETGTQLTFTIEGMDAAPADPEEEKTEEQPEKEETEGTKEEPQAPATGKQNFTDVPETHWAYANVNRAAELGLIKGYADGSFGPERNMSRAEFVTVLWRMSGSPEPKRTVNFEDVTADQWFAKQVAWASESGFVKGADGKFNPNGNITREQVMSILYRCNGSAGGMESMFTEIYDSTFTDSGSISEWARDAVYWSIYEGIVGGMTETTIVPQGNATRAQISTIFLRYLDRQEAAEE